MTLEANMVLGHTNCTISLQMLEVVSEHNF